MILKKFSVVIAGFIVLFLVSISPISTVLHAKKWVIFAFFVALDFLVNLLTEQGMDKNRENFIQFYLSTVVIRMISMLAFIGFGIYKFGGNSNLFVLNVFAFYLFFTIFEISIILRKLRRF